MNALVGTRLGPYEIVAPIGAGGMGEVYRAHDTRLGRDVAIKVLPQHARRRPRRAGTIRTRSARGCGDQPSQHPCAPRYRHRRTASRMPSWSCSKGETLRKRLDSGAASAAQGARMGGAAGARPCGRPRSRDRPSRSEARERVSDPRRSPQDPRLRRGAPPASRRPNVDRNLTTTTEPGVFVGTPAYASPEQVLGEPATPRSDLFAFGVVLHELLTGTHPFRRETVAETMTAILRADPPPLAGAVAGRAAGSPSRDRPLPGETALRTSIVGARCRDVPRRVRQDERRSGSRHWCAETWARRPAGRSSRCSPRRAGCCWPSSLQPGATCTRCPTEP